MTDIDTDVIKRSVTRADYNDSPAGPLYIFAYDWGHRQADLPPYWSHARDRVLRATIQQEPLWAGALSRAITKIAARGWSVTDEDDSQIRTKKGQRLLHHADAGGGWVPFLSKVLRDFLCTDNGAFVEVVRAGPGEKALVLGLVHLDSLRCTRTGVPDEPVLYQDRQGGEHILQPHQVLTFADLPDPTDTYHGVGFCAASRVYTTICRQAAMEVYLLEKLTGGGATELEFLTGISPERLENALITSDSEQRRRGAVMYKGKIVIPVMDDVPVQGYTVALKGVPDGFDATELRQQAAQNYANALGIPVQDIIPLSGQGLGTGTQTLILSEQSEGQGLAAFAQQWLHALNEDVWERWPTTFSWTNENDTRDKKGKADAQLAQAQVIGALMNPQAPVISQQQALQLAADWELIPKEFLPQDATPGDTLSDDEKPVSDEAHATAQALAQRVQGLIGSPPMPQPQQPALKAHEAPDDEGLDALFAAEMAAARQLAQKARAA